MHKQVSRLTTVTQEVEPKCKVGQHSMLTPLRPLECSLPPSTLTGHVKCHILEAGCSYFQSQILNPPLLVVPLVRSSAAVPS